MTGAQPRQRGSVGAELGREHGDGVTGKPPRSRAAGSVPSPCWRGAPDRHLGRARGVIKIYLFPVVSASYYSWRRLEVCGSFRPAPKRSGLAVRSVSLLLFGIEDDRVLGTMVMNETIPDCLWSLSKDRTINPSERNGPLFLHNSHSNCDTPLVLGGGFFPLEGTFVTAQKATCNSNHPPPPVCPPGLPPGFASLPTLKLFLWQPKGRVHLHVEYEPKGIQPATNDVVFLESFAR